MKNCIKCGEAKPLSEYYAHPMMADGHLGICKECHKQKMLQNRNEKIEYYRKYDRDRFQTPARRADIFARSKIILASPKGTEYRKNWNIKNPHKKKAQGILNRELRSGKITKPESCSICGITGKIHAHHDDYTKALDVMWLCPACHSRVHREKRDAQRKLMAEATA